MSEDGRATSIRQADTRRLRHRRRDVSATAGDTPALRITASRGTAVRAIAITSLLSICSFLWFFFRSEILLYGDAVAHINIARRVFDCLHPGILSLGTVWLPLPHLLIIPFIVNRQMWMSGWGASIPSMTAYVLGVIGIYKLVVARVGWSSAMVAAAVFALNPNLLYLQATAMTEPIFLATFVWALVYLDRYLRALGAEGGESFPADKSLEYCAIALAAGMLTRYDGWVYSAVFGMVVLVRWWMWWRRTALPSHIELRDARRTGHEETAPPYRVHKNVAIAIRVGHLRKSLIEFMLLCALVPTLWLAQNYALSGRPLDFMNGPYSAKAIEGRSMQAGGPPHPGTGSIATSTIFFLKAAKLNVSGGWLETPIFLIALMGVLIALRYRSLASLLLLLLPVPFYAYSIAYGSVPIFMPVWWPHSYYNVRYGIELLPAFAVFVGVAFYAATWLQIKVRWVAQAVIVIIVAAGYVLVAAQSPISLREARVNSVSRVKLENRLAEVLRHTPSNSVILMETVDYVGAIQKAGIPLKRVIWEGAHTEWEQSLANPAKYADYVVAIQGDEVSYATRLFPEHLKMWTEFETAGKPKVTVYRVEKK